jgi:hypothetical protein
MIAETLPDVTAVYTISASQGGRSRAVTMSAEEWNIMALVDGHRTLEEICHLSQLDRTKTLMKLAQLKLAGIITKTDRVKKESSGELQQMMNRLSGLFEEYLTEKKKTPLREQRISRTYLEQLS